MRLTTFICLMFTVNAFSQGDTQPPVLVNFYFTLRSLDTSLSSQTMTFTAHLTDDVSGIHIGAGSPTQVQFKSPSGNQSVTVLFDGEENLKSGSNLNGEFSRTITLPRYSESGIWQLSYFLLVDQVNNTLSLNKSALVARGFSAQFEILAGGDANPPNLVSFDFSPTSIDTGQSSQEITFTADLTDDIGGIFSGEGTRTQAVFTSPSGNQAVTVFFDGEDDFVSGSGTKLDGKFSSTATLPQYSEGGIWLLSNFLLVDQLGNQRSLDKSALDAQAFPTSFKVTSQGDTQPPDIVGFDLIPREINIGSSSQTLAFAVHLTDDLSGVYSGGDTSTHARFTSPSGDQTVTVSFDGEDNLVDGEDDFVSTRVDGIFVNSIILPQHSESGVWSISYFVLVDQVGNQKTLTKEELETLELPLPTQFKVVNVLQDCIYDLDGDGFIGTGDYSLFSPAWHSSSGDTNWNARADFDADGFVGTGDYSWFSSNWRKLVDDPTMTYPGDN